MLCKVLLIIVKGTSSTATTTITTAAAVERAAPGYVDRLAEEAQRQDADNRTLAECVDMYVAAAGENAAADVVKLPHIAKA